MDNTIHETNIKLFILILAMEIAAIRFDSFNVHYSNDKYKMIDVKVD